MLSNNQLRVQVDLPAWEWLRFLPVSPSGGLSCTCIADNTTINPLFGRYIYFLINATNFWKYDTYTDTYLQLASPPIGPTVSSSMRFVGGSGHFGQVISAGANTLQLGLPFGNSATGYNVRIISGTGAGQERKIIDQGDPVVADFGSLTTSAQASGVTTLTDTNKNWGSSYTASGVANVNNWAGYQVRALMGTNITQSRRILYNSATVLTTADVNIGSYEVWSNVPFLTLPAAGVLYQIESSTITVDTNWDIVPDNTSRYVIESGGVWLMGSYGSLPYYTLQYYDILTDIWYCKTAITNLTNASPTDLVIETATDNSCVWYSGTATGIHSTTTLQDTTQNWTVNALAGLALFIWTGTGRGQQVVITSNTSNTLTFPVITTAADSTSQYQIQGYVQGISSGNNTYNTLVDTVKTQTVNRWANYGIRIIAGSGSGQIRQVLSNTTTTYAVNVPWTVMPDATSVYLIQGYSESLYVGWGGYAEVYNQLMGDYDFLLHGRPVEYGVASVLCALVSNSSHVISEQPPIALSSLAGTTTITASTATGLSHNLKVGQYVSIRGVTSAAADQYNVCGLQQIATVPSPTTFTYVPAVAGSGTYAYLTALSTSVLSDASKDYRAAATGGSTTSTATITFAANTPSNINGWWVTGTNVTAGARVVSGAGTTTLTLSTAASGSAPTGTMLFTKWAPQVTGTYLSGGTIGLLTVTLSAVTPSYINGWYVTGTNVGLGATVISGAGTATLTLSVVNTGTIAGTLTFSYGAAGYLMHANIGSTQAATVQAVSTGLVTGQLMNVAAHTGNSLGFTLALANIPLAGMTKYVLTKTSLIGAQLNNNTTNYISGIATAGTVTTLTDANAFYNATFSSGGAQGAFTVTLTNPVPANVSNWYVTGTGVGVGAIVTGGAGTATITMNVPFSAQTSGTIVLSAWNQSLVNRRLKVMSGATGLNQEFIITTVSPTTGTLTFGSATAPLAGATYSLLSNYVKGPGFALQYTFGTTVANNKGRYLISSRGGALPGFDKIDLTTDTAIIGYSIPITETLTTGSQYAYDGQDRLYFTKEITLRCYYLDINKFTVHGAGMMPYIAGTTGLGNRMEIFTTQDGLKYLWINRHMSQECFRQLLFY